MWHSVELVLSNQCGKSGSKPGFSYSRKESCVLCKDTAIEKWSQVCAKLAGKITEIKVLAFWRVFQTLVKQCVPTNWPMYRQRGLPRTGSGRFPLPLSPLWLLPRYATALTRTFWKGPEPCSFKNTILVRKWSFDFWRFDFCEKYIWVPLTYYYFYVIRKHWVFANGFVLISGKFKCSMSHRKCWK